MIGSLRGKLSRLLIHYRTDDQFAELVRTSFFAFAVRMIGVVTGFMVTLITGRYFGANSLGIVSICLAILSFASVFGKMGIDVALLKFISSFSATGNKEGMKASYISMLKIVVPVSLGISALLYFFSGEIADQLLNKPYLKRILEINAWVTLPLVLLIIHAEAVRSLKKISLYTFLQTVSVSSIAFLLLVAFYFISPTLYVPAYIQFVSIFISALLSIIVWMKASSFFKVKVINPVSKRTLIETSAAMFTTTLMQLLMTWAGTLILAAYSTEADVGIYNAMSRISIFTNISILAVNSLVQQRFATHFALNDHKALKKESVQATRLIFLSSWPVFIGLFLFPHFILSLFGKDFPGHERELYILLLTQLIVSYVGLPSQILNMTGRQNLLRNISIVAAIVNVSLCFFLTARIGLMGTCIAQLFGTFVWNILSVAAVKKEFGFWTFFKY